ncbi:unnamed protein product [Prunus armeniaca]
MGINPQNPRSNFGVLEGEKLTVAVILGGGVGGWWVVGGCLSTTKGNQGGGEEGLLLARLEGGDELGFWVHGAWGGAWLLDGFRWRVVVGWVLGLELEGGGHGGIWRERERERRNTIFKTFPCGTQSALFQHWYCTWEF